MLADDVVVMRVMGEITTLCSFFRIHHDPTFATSVGLVIAVAAVLVVAALGLFRPPDASSRASAVTPGRRMVSTARGIHPRPRSQLRGGSSDAGRRSAVVGDGVAPRSSTCSRSFRTPPVA